MKKITQSQILDMAEEMMHQTNKADVTLSQVATKLGVTHAAIYKHYLNKQELMEALTDRWFQRNIVEKLEELNEGDPRQQLHQLLWSFVSAKKQIYNDNPNWFSLNTRYVDSNPTVLHNVLKPVYQQINQIMGYQDTDYVQAENILSAFAMFTLPNFKSLWNKQDFQERFERMWLLIADGLFES